MARTEAKFFNFLIDHHSEWKSIRNNDPLGYLPYMEAQFEQVTGYKLVGLGPAQMDPSGHLLPLGNSPAGGTRSVPRLAGTPPPEGPMTPPPFPPVTAAVSPATATPAAPAAPPVPAAPPATAVTSTQATAPNPTGRGADDPDQSLSLEKGTPLLQVSKAPPGIREVLGTPSTGVAEQRLESPVRPGVARRSIAGPSPGRGIRGRRLRSPSRIAKADFRPSKRYMRRPVNINWPAEITALRGLQVIHPEMGADDLQHLNNQVLLMIAEYHLTSASQGTHHIQPVLPEGATRLMSPVDEYLPGSFEGCREVRVTDRAQILRIATWLHRLDLAATYSVETANSPQVEEL